MRTTLIFHPINCQVPQKILNYNLFEIRLGVKHTRVDDNTHSLFYQDPDQPKKCRVESNPSNTRRVSNPTTVALKDFFRYINDQNSRYKRYLN